MSIPNAESYPLPQADELIPNKVTWPFEPGRAALLIHDMQNYFLKFWGADSPLVSQVVANIVRLRQQCDALGIPVFYTAQPAQQSPEDRALLNDMWGPGLNRHPQEQQVVAELMPRPQDKVLTKWRYSAFQRSPLEQQLKELGRDQLLITGVYAHIGCLTTATDAFMRDIKPFMVADALADFSRDDHLMALKYTAGRCGKVVFCEELLLLPDSKAALRALVLPLLEDDEQPQGDENLIDYGLDSVRVMALAARWRQAIPTMDFMTLAKTPTLNGWWALLSQGDQS